MASLVLKEEGSLAIVNWINYLVMTKFIEFLNRKVKGYLREIDEGKGEEVARKIREIEGGMIDFPENSTLHLPIQNS